MAKTTIQINVSIPKTLNTELREQAEKEGRSLSNLVANILKEGMETRNNECIVKESSNESNQSQIIRMKNESNQSISTNLDDCLLVLFLNFGIFANLKMSER